MENKFYYPFPMTSTTATVLLILKNPTDPDASKFLVGMRSADADAYPNTPCIPGGFLNAKTQTSPGEKARATAVREVFEETNIEVDESQLVLFEEYSDPDIDPRAHVVNLCYYVELTQDQANSAKAGDDLQNIHWQWINGDVGELAFNHTVIVEKGIKAWKDSLVPQTIAPEPPAIKSKRYVGLAVMRTQPLHLGHTRIIDTMIRDNDVAIVGLGSCNSPSTPNNPFSPDQRKQMLKNVYGDRIKIVMLSDLGITPGKEDWVNYVLEKISKLGLPDPTDYYSGSHGDSVWYKSKFSHSLSTDIRYSLATSSGYICRRLHIMDRDIGNIPSATSIRSLISLGDAKWKEWTPRVNHQFIEDNFPNEFKIGY